MFPKAIVTTGCSYGIFYEALKNMIKIQGMELPGLEMIFDLHGVSLGSTFQALSIIETVDKLLEAGTKGEDIFVLAEFSEIKN